MFRVRHRRTPRGTAPTLLLILAVAIPAACSAPAPAAGSSTALSEVLPLIPSDTSYLTVTDWTAIKSGAGHKAATSASSSSERHQAYTDIYAHQATASKFANDTITFDLGSTIGTPPPPGQLSNQAKEWGFDALDLRWDASVFEPGARDGVLLLRLRQGIDLGTLSSLFDKRGFRTETIDGATVRDLGGAAFAGGQLALEPAMSNTAFLPDGITLAMSTSLQELTTYLAYMKSGAPPAITSAATQLDNPWAAAFLAGTPACGYFNPPAGWTLDPSFSDGLSREIKGVGTLSPFQAVAIGYSGDQTPNSRITFVFGDAASATNDLAGRELLAQNAYRLAADHKTYASTVFTVTSAKVVGTDLNLNVTPVNDAPIQLFEAFASRDLVPAVCDF